MRFARDYELVPGCAENDDLVQRMMGVCERVAQ